MRSDFRSKASALALLLLASGCATVRMRAPGNGPVITNEPPVPAGGPTAAQPPIEEAGSPAAIDAARLVANDGRWSDVIHDDLVIVPALCYGAMPGYLRDPLAETGVYRAFGTGDALGSWVSVGIALGGDGIGAAYYEGACGSTWTDRVLARTGRLAPAVAGRDTSLLFTTARRQVAGSAGAAAAAAAILGSTVGRSLPQGTGSGNEGRTAKPRTAPQATPAPASSPSSAAPSAPAPAATPAAPAKAPATPPAKSDSDDRPAKAPGGGDRAPDPVRRPWGSH